MTEVPPTELSIGQQLLHSTVRIECVDANGGKSSGTGFNFSFEIDGMFVPTIITNRHVFQSAVEFDFHYTLADADGRSIGKHERYAIHDFAKAWIGHPDPDVDLALVPIQPLLAQEHAHYSLSRQRHIQTRAVFCTLRQREYGHQQSEFEEDFVAYLILLMRLANFL